MESAGMNSASTSSETPRLLTTTTGYGGRLLLHDDPFSKWGFKINVVLLTIAPAFLSAGLYIMLKRLVLLFGPQYSRISPNAYAYVFVSADVISIILQGAGGAISAVATEKTFLDQGVDIMIAGLVSQVFTLSIFAGLCVDFTRQVYRHQHLLHPARQALMRSLRFKFVTGAMTFAFLCIQTRCAYRVAELSQGWGSELMRKEDDFIIMDSVLVFTTPPLMTDDIADMHRRMCIAAAASLNIFHPGYSLPEPNETHDDRAEQVQAQEKTKGYTTLTEDVYLAPPPPLFRAANTNTCPRCACWEDRRSWI